MNGLLRINGAGRALNVMSSTYKTFPLPSLHLDKSTLISFRIPVLNYKRYIFKLLRLGYNSFAVIKYYYWKFTNRRKLL